MFCPDDEVLFGLQPSASRQLQVIAPIEPAPVAKVDIFDAKRSLARPDGWSDAGRRAWRFHDRASILAIRRG